MADMNEFFLNITPSEVMLECIEVKHSLWSDSLRYVRNHGYGVTVKHEDGEYYDYEYMPLLIQRGGASNDLDQTIKITVGDLGEVVPDMVDAIVNAEIDERPQIIYRVYSSADMDEALFMIDGLYVEDDSSDHQGTTFNAASKRANSNETGMRYTVDEFPGLRGFFA